MCNHMCCQTRSHTHIAHSRTHPTHTNKNKRTHTHTLVRTHTHTRAHTLQTLASLSTVLDRSRAEEVYAPRLLEQYLHLLLLAEYLVCMTCPLDRSALVLTSAKQKAHAAKAQSTAMPNLAAPLPTPLSQTYVTWIRDLDARDEFYYYMDTLADQLNSS